MENMLDKMEAISLYTKKMKVLYVEDDYTTLEVISELLEELFAEVIITTNGEDALDQFQQNQNIQIVISDVNMPKMDGLELAKHIKNINSATQIIILTQHNDLNIFMESMLLKVDSYVLKPINFHDLFLAIEQVLKKIDKL